MAPTPSRTPKRQGHPRCLPGPVGEDIPRLQDTPFSIDELKVLLTGKLAKYEMPTEMEMGASPPKAPVKNWPKKELGARRGASLATVVGAAGLTQPFP